MCCLLDRTSWRPPVRAQRLGVRAPLRRFAPLLQPGARRGLGASFVARGFVPGKARQGSRTPRRCARTGGRQDFRSGRQHGGLSHHEISRENFKDYPDAHARCGTSCSAWMNRRAAADPPDTTALRSKMRFVASVRSVEVIFVMFVISVYTEITVFYILIK